MLGVAESAAVGDLCQAVVALRQQPLRALDAQVTQELARRPARGLSKGAQEVARAEVRGGGQIGQQDADARCSVM